MATYFVGWDVGAWYCDKNSNSRDAICVYDQNGHEVCTRRQVVRTELQESSVSDFLNAFFRLDKFFHETDYFYFAIDAVFAFPLGLQKLQKGNEFLLSPEAWEIGNSIENNLLFRYTEKFVAEQMKRPLSVIQDSIGSQSTKIMYFLQRFLFKPENTGVWSCVNAKAIETYPSILGQKGTDEEDAKLCAMLAKRFVDMRNDLVQPPAEFEEVIEKEGWIWFPQGKKQN